MKYELEGWLGDYAADAAPKEIPVLPEWRQAKYIVLDVEDAHAQSLRLQILFYARDPARPPLRFHVALFPGVAARVVFDLRWLDSQLCFPPLQPGTLKSGIGGPGMSVSEAARAVLSLSGGGKGKLTVKAAHLTEEEPTFPPPTRVNCDRFGQWMDRDWPGKVRDEAELASRLWSELDAYPNRFPTGMGRFGGCATKRYEAKGFFYALKDDGRWRLVDPDGCAFFSVGVFGVYPGEPGWVRGVEGYHAELPPREGAFEAAWHNAGDLELFRRKFDGMFPNDTGLYSFATGNLIRAFGADWRAQWTRMTQARLRAWGVNTLSMFSDPDFVRESGLAYVVMLTHFPETKTRIYREFPDVFSPEYEARCREFARQLDSVKDDPRLIGYFLNNEPTWGFERDVIMAEKMLEMAEDTESRRVFARWIAARYDGNIAALNAAWGGEYADFECFCAPQPKGLSVRSTRAREDLLAFTRLMYERYASLPSRFAREVDPNHLNLGMRFAGVTQGDPLLVTAKYFDVFSFNCYQLDPTPVLSRLPEDMPALVGEFHFGALDRGLPSASLVPVASQEARADAYRGYLRALAGHPNVVGGHYFAYNDQPLWGRYDGENYQFGFVDVCAQPYAPFVEGVRQAACEATLGEAAL